MSGGGRFARYDNLVADAPFVFESGKSRGTKASRWRAFPRFSRMPDMFRQAISLMIIQRYSSRLDGRSKHEAINLGASQVGKNSKSIHQLQCLNLCFG
jgi:hypothetical protein